DNGDSADSGTAAKSVDPDASTCPAAVAPPADLCKALPTGTVSACSRDAAGHPSQNGYLDIAGADGSHRLVCAPSRSPKPTDGYSFAFPDQLMSDPQSCCGGAPTPVAAPATPQPAFGYLGALHAPRGIKPQETLHAGTGALREDPFAVIVADSNGAAALATA